MANLIITGNQADKGGGIYIKTGGNGSFSLGKGMVYGNKAGEGGGIYILGNDGVRIFNSVFGGNEGKGSAIYNASAITAMINSSFCRDNMFNDYSHPTIENSIFYGGLDLISSDSFSNATISYSMVESCNPGGTWNAGCGSDGGHNLQDEDPLFSDVIGLNFHLFSTSPMINQGNNYYIGGVITDMDGNPRIAPTGGSVDLGAYEYQPALPSLQAFTKYGSKDHPAAFQAVDFSAHFSGGSGTGLIKVKILSLPAHGTLTLDATAVTIGQEIPLGSLNQLLFTPDQAWYDSTSFLWNGEDSLAYAVSGVNANLSVLGLNVFLPFILH